MSIINEVLRQTSNPNEGEEIMKFEKNKESGKTVVGRSVIIKGKLKGDEDLIVRGRVEADITSNKALTIEDSGIVKADVKVRSIQISGVLVGNVMAEEKVEIASNGKVVGNIQSPRVIMYDGAAVRGRVDMESMAVAQENTPASVKSFVNYPEESGYTEEVGLDDNESAIEDAVLGDKKSRNQR